MKVILANICHHPCLPIRLVLNGFTTGINLIGKQGRSEEHTSELQSRSDLVCRLLLEKKKKTNRTYSTDKANKMHCVADHAKERRRPSPCPASYTQAQCFTSTAARDTLYQACLSRARA